MSVVQIALERAGDRRELGWAIEDVLAPAVLDDAEAQRCWWACDEESGRLTGVTVWADEPAYLRGRTAAARCRSAVLDRFGARVLVAAAFGPTAASAATWAPAGTEAGHEADDRRPAGEQGWVLVLPLAGAAAGAGQELDALERRFGAPTGRLVAHDLGVGWVALTWPPGAEPRLPRRLPPLGRRPHGCWHQLLADRSAVLDLRSAPSPTLPQGTGRVVRPRSEVVPIL